ncbi:MAG: hypothetical protein J6S71_04950 [Clostridia bacterium]|nr:hypothetical protein [Clostridia bacterium]
MKKVLILSKIILFVLIAVLIFAVIGIPLTMTFTTNDRSASLDFFIENLIEFLALAPFLLLAIFPAFVLKSYASFKLDDLSAPALRKHLCIFSIAEIITIILTIIIIISINSNNSAQLL